ncbi:GntP family permease [Janibacter corallicola]|uniref:GntP family permease n=1 Tax=Janibacter corallicola TaxID=415212 RepID=UPI00082F60C3|nr:GntP family permease [Janibacter corallicola]
MEPMDPAYSTGIMLLVAAIAVAVLLVLILALKLHAFISLVLVSILTAIAVQVPVSKIPDVLMYGFSDTLASVALLVAFGVMLGRILEVSGGAQTLADTMISRFGEHRAPFALGVASLLFGFPIFFDAGLVVFLPIIMTVARRFGGSLLYYALPAAGAFAVMHAIVPPHPGPVAAAQFLGADIGYTLLIGLPVVAISWYVGVYLFSRVISPRVFVGIPDFLASGGASTADEAAGGTQGPPSFGAVSGLLLLPLVLISMDTVTSTLSEAGVIDGDATWVSALSLLGQTYVALMITVLVAIWMLIVRGRGRAEVEQLLNDSLGPICAIILITGAGGMFGGVLELSGIGGSLADSLDALGLPLIIAAFVIAAGIRVAQGSATVALVTASGIIAPAVEATGGLNQVELVALVIAIAAGATVLSHVNDSGFWLVSRFFGMDEKTTLKAWTVQETTLGLVAFLCGLVLWYVF